MIFQNLSTLIPFILVSLCNLSSFQSGANYSTLSNPCAQTSNQQIQFENCRQSSRGSARNKKKAGATSNVVNPPIGCELGKNFEVALRIDNLNYNNNLIKTVGFFVHTEGRYQTPFRIRFYSIGKNQEPATELDFGMIVKVAYQKGAWNEFDLSNMGIIIPSEGCYVSMQWLNSNKFEDTFLLRDGIKRGFGQTLNLTREFSTTKWYSRINEEIWSTSGTINWNQFELTNYNPMINITYVRI